jgi:hypothetical protein
MTATKEKETSGLVTKRLAKIGIFPKFDKEKINYPGFPYSIRNDCRGGIGQWKVGSDDLIGNKLDVAILHFQKFYGNLGKTNGAEWLQLWFVGAPSEDKLPKNTVCMTYIKSIGLRNFYSKIFQISDNPDADALIFTLGFQKESNKHGDYYSVTITDRPRKEDEMGQLELIADFLETNPKLVDTSLPPSMVSLAEYDIEEAKTLIEIHEENEKQRRLAEAK